MSKQMLNEQTFTAANIERVGASGDRTMSVNGVIARTLVLFAVTVVFGVIGWTRAEGVLTASPLLVIGGFAALIDQMNDLRNSDGCSPGMARHASTAITMMEDAQMRAVKALTWRH
mgnify:CR=1 FL=1